jgi:glycosyltransferase involved in cell wall biosynthesis
MKRRLVILTEIIAPYRIPVFNSLARHEEIDLHVIFLAQTNPDERQWLVYADEIRFSYQVLPSWRMKLANYGLLVNLNVSEALKRADPEVVLCGGYNYPAAWQAQRWARQHGVAFLLWCESTANDQRAGHVVIESLKRNFLAKCDAFVVPGDSARRYVEQMQCSGKRIFVAPNAVDNDLFASRAQAARANANRLRGKLGLPARYFLFVGRLLKSKGVFDLLEAYASLGEALRSEVGLVFAGDGSLRAQLESRAHSIFPGAVHFAGFVQRDDLPAYYALADSLVFPTHSDTWGMVVNESMACGVPVICSEVAGCAANLVQTNGRLVPSHSVTHLTAAMKEVALDAALRERMATESRRIIQNYSPEFCARGIARSALATNATFPRDTDRLNLPPGQRAAALG